MGCEMCNSEIEYLRNQNRELLETLTSLLKPKSIEVVSEESVSAQKLKIRPVGTWSKRRKELEQQERIKTHIEQNSKVMGKPDKVKTIDDLEAEVGLVMDGDKPMLVPELVQIADS